MQRIVDADACADLQRRQLQRRRAHRRPRHCQHGIDSDRAQQGALARHVRAAHQQHARLSAEVATSLHTRAAAGISGWPSPIALIAGEPLEEFGKRVRTLLVCVLGERHQRFELAQHFEPRADDGTVGAAPALGGKRGLQRVHQQQHERRQNRIAARLDEIDDGGEFGEGGTRRSSCVNESLRCSVEQRRGLEALRFDEIE